MFKRNFFSRNPKTMKIIYNTYVSPILNYASPVWNPKYKGQVQKINNICNRFWKCSSAEGSSPEHLTRLKADLVLMHKMQKKEVDLNFDKFFSVIDYNMTRGAKNVNVKVPKCKKECRKQSFSIRSINSWNKIPLEKRQLSSKAFVRYLNQESLQLLNNFR